MDKSLIDLGRKHKDALVALQKSASYARYYVETGDEDKLLDELCFLFDIFIYYLPMLRGACEAKLKRDRETK